MRRQIRIYGMALLAAIMMVACGKVPDGILSEKKMQAVLTDMLLAEAMVTVDNETYKSDTMKMALYESVFRKYRISRADYDSSLVWYGRNLDVYIKVYERVVADVKQRIKDMGDVQAVDASTSNQDSVDIWPRRPYLVLSPSAVFNGVIFNVRPKSSYSSGSSFVLGMRVWGLDPKMAHKPEIRISAEHNDTTITVNRQITRDGYHEIILKTLATKRVRRVYGYIRLDNADTAYSRIYIDSLSLMKYKYGRDFEPSKDSIP